MYLDAFTLSALVDEFMDVLVGGRVQDSIDVDDTGIGLEVYARQRRRYLYISGDPQTPRIHFVSDKLRRGLNRPTNLGLMFRRFVEGGQISHVSQPPWEQILQIDVDGPEGRVSIVVEPMERRSNILLLREGIILDCLRRVGPNENRYRVSLPAHPYVMPPPQTGKLDPTLLTLPDLVNLFEQNEDPKRKTQQVLTSRLLGVSPLMAREVVFRAGGAVEQPSSKVEPAALLTALQSVVGPLARREWQPGVADGERGVAAYSVYPLEHLEGWHRVESLSEAMSLYYGAAIGPEAYDAGKQPIRDAIAEARARLGGKLASLQRSMTDDSEREVLRQSGDLILAYQYTLAPKQTELRAQYEVDAPELVIPLDPKMTPLENAQHYFERYNKAKRALDDVPELIQGTQTELDVLAQLETDLELARNWPEIDEVQQALQARGHWRGTPRQRIAGGGNSAPLRFIAPGDFVVWVGRNSRQNEMVTFDKGSPPDLWLHVHDVPGAHVIVKNDGRKIPESVIEQAASLAAYYSGKRSEGRVTVDVTERRYVRKIKGGAPGMVTYRNETTRVVSPSSEQDLSGA